MTMQSLIDLNDHITIDVNSYFFEQREEGNETFFLFGYDIKVTNHSDIVIKILRRHWFITDSNGEQVEVEGEGVIGLQPEIASQGYFEYSSGSQLPTPVGTMHGTYTIETADGQQFKAIIKPFRLAMPGIIH